MQPLVISVVIPTYKRPALLLRCVEAVMLQHFDKAQYEIIVVSDGVDPSTAAALSALPAARLPALAYYALPEKSGPAAARNFGSLLAQGELIVFTDDDCIPDEKWLNAMWTAYKEQELEAVAFSGNTIVPVKQEPTDYERNIAQLASAEFITANCACSRTALAQVGGFDERFRMAWREDSDLQFKFIEKNIPIVKVWDACVTHPVRKAPWGISIREERKGMFNALLYKKFPGLYRKKIQPTPPWHYYGISVFLILFVAGVVTDRQIIKVAGFAGWFTLTSWFALHRLRHTSRSLPHVSEMVFTSAVIPILSLFWKFYGSWKYRVLLIP